MGAEVTIPGRISSAIILASAVRTAAAPKAHLSFHISNIESSASCVVNSGLRREKLFLKATAAANSAAIYSMLGINTVIFQTQSMLLQASRRVFP